MARIAGVDLPARKRADIGLTYIYGVGRTRAASILHRCEIDGGTKISDLSDDQVNKIRLLLESEGAIEGDLRKEISMNIKRLMDLGCYALQCQRAFAAWAGGEPAGWGQKPQVWQ